MTGSPATRLYGMHCRMQIETLAPGVVRIQIEGRDAGEFGLRPMRDVEARLADSAAGTLFIDARATDGASMQVSRDWALWLGRHRDRLDSVHMLHRSHFVRVTAEFVRRFSSLDQVMHLYEEEANFEAVLARHLPTAG